MRIWIFALASMVLACPAAASERFQSHQLPLFFAKNEGQADARIRYVSRGRNLTLALGRGEAFLTPGGSRELPIRIRFGHAIEPEGLDPLPWRSNFLMGNDPALWRTGVAKYSKVRYRNVRPGIDLIYHGSQRQLEFDFVVAPGADYRKITLRFEGAKKLRIAGNGDLLVQTANGELRQHKPVVYTAAGTAT
ncbi:MAG: hypothetical protein WKF37_05660 [Bryobacteraceae bacterium]